MVEGNFDQALVIEQCGTEFEDPFPPKAAFSPTHIHIPAHICIYIRLCMPRGVEGNFDQALVIEQCGTELSLLKLHSHPRTYTYLLTYVYTYAYACHAHIDGLSEGGAVVDLTNDSGVEDEDVVDLTSPIQVSLTFELVSMMTC